MRRVIIESPYAGEVEANVAYARRAVRDSLERGEAPIASHLLYTQPNILDDLDPEERSWGISAGLAWRDVAEAVVFYVDLGWSKGMQEACMALINGVAYPGPPVLEVRKLDGEAIDRLDAALGGQT